MDKKSIYFNMLLLLAAAILIRPAYSQSIPEPQMAVDCYGTLEAWKNDKNLRDYMATHNCYCPSPNSRPVCTPKDGRAITTPRLGSSLSPSQQMQLLLFQSVMQPFFNSLFNFESLFSHPAPEASYQQKPQEEAKKKVFEAWKRHLDQAEEQARREAENRRKAGQNILSQVKIGSGPFGSYTIIGPKVLEKETLSGIDWDNPRAQASSTIKKSPEIAKEQLLKSAYFSKMAETFLESGDLEAARFYAGLAFEGGAGNAPRAIDYTPPKELLDAMDTKKAIELNNQLAKYASFYRIARPNFEKLQNIFTKLEEVKNKKEESERKVEEIESQIKKIVAKKQISETPEKKGEYDDLLAKAIALKQQAEAEYQEAIHNEQKLMIEKQEIEGKLNELRKNLFEKNN
ncbi:MAG: hypothetical protein ACPL5I_02020 [Thermodesulfobacteriota bacterium]